MEIIKDRQTILCCLTFITFVFLGFLCYEGITKNNVINEDNDDELENFNMLDPQYIEDKVIDDQIMNPMDPLNVNNMDHPIDMIGSNVVFDESMMEVIPQGEKNKNIYELDIDEINCKERIKSISNQVVGRHRLTHFHSGKGRGRINWESVPRIDSNLF
jgi:hypothetical protein